MRRLSITDEAQQQITNIADYLDSEWSIRVRDNFLRKIDVAVQTIIQMPFAFPEAENLPDIRRCVVHKYTSIYYRVTLDEVEILAVWDNRQDLWSP